MAKEPVAVTAKTKERGPEITFDSLVYDFGKIGPGRKMTGKFQFTNTGDAPLKITEVKKCCGAVTKLDKDEFEPGESGILEVTYTSGRTPTKMRKKLYVTTNDTKTPQAELTITAEIVLRVDYEPRLLKLLLKDENAGCPKITLTSADGTPFSIAKFTSTGNFLTADFDSSMDATQFILEPKVDMEKIKKSSYGRANITLAFSQPEQASETVTITYRVLSRFSLTPAMLIVAYDRPREPVKKTLWLTNNYGEDFEVESTTSKEGHVKVISQRKSGNRYQFTLEITPPADRDVKKFTDTFTIGLKNDEPIEVSCRGIYRAPKTNNAGE